MGNSTKKVAFVTGGNRGIGLETAKQLAAQGVHVVIGARDLKKGLEIAKSFGGDAIAFEVNNLEHHKDAARYFETKHGRLDILVNNAGIMIEAEDASAERVNRTSTLPTDILKKTFDTNFFAPVALTQTLLPLIKKSDAGRIVNLSSILGSLTLHATPDSPIYDSKIFAYDTTKAALNSFTIHLAQELKDTKIKVNSAHPGWVKTEMGGENGMLEVPDGAKTSVQLALLGEDGPTGGFFHLGDSLPW
jgi:NAD(P)-dependent dehydrogenase (short-subunit alcohol dehydrogenase family)